MQIKTMVFLSCVLLVVVLFCGCNETKNGTVLSISDIRNNADKYAGQEVTVRGFYDSGNMILPSNNISTVIIDSGLRIIKLADGIECIHLEEYYFTGIVEKFSIRPDQPPKYVGLNVTKVELV